MALKSQFETRCEDCGGRIRVGEEIHYLSAVGGLRPESRHVVCPEKKTTTTNARRPARQIDHDGLFAMRKCSREGPGWSENVKWTRGHMNVCGKSFTFPKGQRVPTSCPECGAGWSTVAFWEAA